MQNVTSPLGSPCFIHQELHEVLEADSSIHSQTPDLEAAMPILSSSDQSTPTPENTVAKERHLFLSVGLQIQSVMRLVERYHSVFSNLREEYLEYTPRQLVLIGLIKKFKSSKNDEYIRLMNEVVTLNQFQIDSIEIPSSQLLTPIYRVLINQISLLDIPFKKINLELDASDPSMFSTIDTHHMNDLTIELVSALKDSAERIFKKLKAFMGQCKYNYAENKKLAAKALKKKSKRFISPNQVTLEGAELGRGFTDRMNLLSLKMKTSLMKLFEQILRDARKSKDAQDFSFLESQIESLNQCYYSMDKQVQNVREFIFSIMKSIEMQSRLIGSSETVQDTFEQQTSSQSSELSRIDINDELQKMQAHHFYEKQYSDIKTLHFLITVFCRNYAVFLNKQASQLKENQSLQSFNSALFSTEQVELSPEENAQVLIELQVMVDDSDDVVELAKKPPKASEASSSSSSSSSSDLDPASKHVRLRRGKSRRHKGKRNSQKDPRKIIEEPLEIKQRTPIQQSGNRDAISEIFSSSNAAPMTFIEMRQNYAELWECGVNEFSQKQSLKMRTGYFKSRIDYHQRESIQHLRYSFVGFDLMAKAVQRKNWSALGEIIPSFLMDLAIQLEQLLTVCHIAQKKSNILYHDLVCLAEMTTDDVEVTPETMHYLEQIKLAMMWARYPVSAKFYYKSRNLECPQGLKLILQSQQLMRGKEISVAALTNFIEELFSLYENHLLASAEILKLLTGSEEIGLVASRVGSMIGVEKDQILSGMIVPKEEQSQEVLYKDAITILSTIESKIKNLYQEIRGEGFEREMVKMKVKEAVSHLNRLRKILQAYGKEQSLHHQAWFFRSYLKVQQVLEALYQLRVYIRGESAKQTHHLSYYHDVLKDPEEMKSSLMFDFGKQIHYSRWSNSHPSASELMNHLHRLEEEMENQQSSGFVLVTRKQRRSPTMSNGYVHSDSHMEMFRHVVEQSLVILNMHIEACMREQVTQAYVL